MDIGTVFGLMSLAYSVGYAAGAEQYKLACIGLILLIVLTVWSV